MAIYILDNSKIKCSTSLDDKSLDFMIRDIVQVLCNVHNLSLFWDPKNPPPFPGKESKFLNAWTEWVIKCKDNYLYLFDLGIYCCSEWCLRNYYEYFKKPVYNKFWESLVWCRNNIPDLPSIGCMSTLPLIMPKKYIIFESFESLKIEIKEESNGWTSFSLSPNPDLIGSYRNYYCVKLINASYSQWTNRGMPEWLNI